MACIASSILVQLNSCMLLLYHAAAHIMAIAEIACVALIGRHGVWCASMPDTAPFQRSLCGSGPAWRRLCSLPARGSEGDPCGACTRHIPSLKPVGPSSARQPCENCFLCGQGRCRRIDAERNLRFNQVVAGKSLQDLACFCIYTVNHQAQRAPQLPSLPETVFPYLLTCGTMFRQSQAVSFTIIPSASNLSRGCTGWTIA